MGVLLVQVHVVEGPLVTVLLFNVQWHVHIRGQSHGVLLVSLGLASDDGGWALVESLGEPALEVRLAGCQSARGAQRHHSPLLLLHLLRRLLHVIKVIVLA